MTITRDTNIVWGDPNVLFIQSEKDGLYIMPWKLLHEGYSVTRQETVVSVNPDAGIPISHSRFSAGGRIIAAKVFVTREEDFWYWFGLATNNRAIPCWVLDPKTNGFMRCYILEQPEISPAGSSIKGMFANLKLYARTMSIPVRNFITENTPERIVIEGDGALVYQSNEVMY